MFGCTYVYRDKELCPVSPRTCYAQDATYSEKARACGVGKKQSEATVENMAN
jgi:rubredoxin